MRLSKWRELKGLTQAKVAELLEITEVSVCRHETGVRFPPPPMQEKYEAISEGAITPRDWVEQWNDPAAVHARAKEEDTRQKRKAAAA